MRGRRERVCKGTLMSARASAAIRRDCLRVARVLIFLQKEFKEKCR
jgi:hypothetical protein